MQNMEKGLTVPKWALINWLEVPQMPQNLSAQIVCPSPKVWDFDEKKALLGVHSLWLGDKIQHLTNDDRISAIYFQHLYRLFLMRSAYYLFN